MARIQIPGTDSRDSPPEIRKLLERRAERLRARPQVIEDQAVLHVAEFPIGTERYAIALNAIRAVAPLRAVTPVPLASPHIIGILRFHGQVITALSLSGLLGGHGWSQDPTVLLVVDSGSGQLVAFDSEQIPIPSKLSLVSVDQARAQGKQGTLLEVTTEGARHVNLIDIRRLLTLASQRSEPSYG